MPDTRENQVEYPQQSGQKPGCGFPIARIVVVFSLAVGTVLDAAISKYQGKQTGENSLFRTLHGLLENDDVVLADRYFSGGFDLALLKQRGVHSVVRKHQLRGTDFRRGQRGEVQLWTPQRMRDALRNLPHDECRWDRRDFGFQDGFADFGASRASWLAHEVVLNCYFYG